MQVKIKETMIFLVWLLIVIVFSYFAPKSTIILATPYVYKPQTFNETYVALSVFNIGDKVVMRANVTTQGGYSINKVILNLTDSNSVQKYTNTEMTNKLLTCSGPVLCRIYEKNYTLSQSPPDSPGTWKINVTANDTDNYRASNSTTFEVSVWVSITPSQAILGGVMFGAVDPNTNDNPALNDTTGDGGGTDYNITIDTSSNVNVDLYHRATGNLVYSGNSIGINNVSHAANTTSNTGNNLDDYTEAGDLDSIAMSTSYAIIGGSGVCSNLQSSNNCWMTYWLDVPSGQVPGDYDTDYEYCGVQNGQGSAQCG
jgi:hypothetical protein